MNIEIIGKNGLEITDSMKNYTEEKLERIKEIFHKEVKLNIRVVCKVYKETKKVEITGTLKGFIVRAEITNDDMYIAIDQAIEKIITQIKKHNSQVKHKLSKDGIKDVFTNDLDIEDLEKEVLANQLIKNKKIELEAMTTEEAISNMELLNHDFYVFLNNSTNKVNVIYLRDDENYAIIETN